MYCRSCVLKYRSDFSDFKGVGLDVSPLAYPWLGFLHFGNQRKHGFHGRPTPYLRAQKPAFSRCYQVLYYYDI